MKLIKQSENEHHWPRNAVAQVETRKRDLVIRIADWTRDRECPGYDVEVYIGGVYDWNESQTFSPDFTSTGQAKQFKQDAIDFAKQQIQKLL